MTYKEIIDNIKPFEYSKYRNITSFEKLMLYAAKYLTDHGVPLTFNYLCVASFNFFPETFCMDNEFKQHLSPDRLNRTIMHLKYTQKSMPYLSGKQETGYELTKLGKMVAEEVEAVILNTKIDKTIKAPIVDKHKKGTIQDYSKFINSEAFKQFELSEIVDINLIWEYFNVIPYTQIKRIKATLSDIGNYAVSQKNEKCNQYIKKILERI